jgi:hypothetical protein
LEAGSVVDLSTGTDPGHLRCGAGMSYHEQGGRVSMGRREQFFAGVLVSDRDEYQFHSRAWDAAEAEFTFREALRADGFAELGTLEIRDAKGAG